MLPIQDEMKTEQSDKHRRTRTAELKKDRPFCGTLDHLAACRRAARKGEALGRTAPVTIAMRLERRIFPA